MMANKRKAAVAPATSRRNGLDNIIRRELRVGDPSDPSQVAQALLERYQSIEAAKAWLHKPESGLGGQRPADFLTAENLKRLFDHLDALTPPPHH